MYYFVVTKLLQNGIIVTFFYISALDSAIHIYI